MKLRGKVNLQLAAVTRAEDASAALDALKRIGVEALSVEAAELAAVLVSGRRSLWRTRKRVSEELMQFQRQLEALHTVVDVLPAAPGAILPDVDSAERFLIGSASVLRQGLERFSDAEQHQILVELPSALLFRSLTNDPAMAEARELIEAGQRLEAGRVAQRIAEAAKDKLRAEWIGLLTRSGRDWAALPQPSEDAVVHLALLADRLADPAIEATLKGIDGEWDGSLNIRMIGPSPVSAFASILVETPDPERQYAAANLVGVFPEEGAAAVKAAYLTAMKRLQPDVAGPAVAEEARQITLAQAELLPVAQAWDALRAAGAAEGASPLMLARLHREGDRRESDLDAWERDVDLEAESASSAAAFVDNARQGVA